VSYSSHWGSFPALKRHLIANNTEITLVREAPAIEPVLPVQLLAGIPANYTEQPREA